MYCTREPKSLQRWKEMKKRISWTLPWSSLQESGMRSSINMVPQSIVPLILVILLPRTSHWCWSKSQEGQKSCSFINVEEAAVVLFFYLYLMPLLGCSKCTKTSGCLWSGVAGAAALKKLNKWQQERKNVTLSPRSTAVPQPQHAIFLTSYISLVIFGWLIEKSPETEVTCCI